MTRTSRSSEYKFDIEYLIARYKFEPALRDLFVEGRSDVAILKRFAEQTGLRRLSVYSIDNVNVPPEFVEDYHGSGNRGRVIALAYQLSAGLSDDAANVFCLADRDLDTVLGGRCACYRLWFTDFSSIEAYLFHREFFKHIYGTYFGIEFSQPNFDRAVEISHLLFLVRSARQTISPALEWVGASGSLKFDRDTLAFDLEQYFHRFLVSKGAMPLVTQFRSQIQSFPALGGQDQRNRIHKDDFLEIIAWCARRRGADASLCKIEVLGRLLLSHLNGTDLLAYPLFTKIRAWANNASQQPD